MDCSEPQLKIERIVNPHDVGTNFVLYNVIKSNIELGGGTYEKFRND
ncbi:hypothetical protein MU1_52920 [Paenibacillus glycanilyticus]|uniref:Uncharacterized protein n=1 Tax=Paenibacillus glycanilyticus TaxID=126569 RepID=A0ABQ6GJ30_9BACL|nr:hypothetical protein MU1_52920 [Paenibacillus glycanilyticus]